MNTILTLGLRTNVNVLYRRGTLGGSWTWCVRRQGSGLGWRTSRAAHTVRLRTREQAHAATCTSTCSNAAKPAACSELWRSASRSARAAASAIPEEEAAIRTSRQRQSARFEVCARPLRATTSRDHLGAQGHCLGSQPHFPTSGRVQLYHPAGVDPADRPLVGACGRAFFVPRAAVLAGRLPSDILPTSSSLLTSAAPRFLSPPTPSPYACHRPRRRR